MGIQVLIHPPSAILQADIILTFSAVDGNATGNTWNLYTIQLPYMPTYPLSMNSYLHYFTIYACNWLCISFTVTSYLLAVGEDFRLVFQMLTLCPGTSNNNVQSLVVDILDDFLVEGTESFVISGNATAPALFVPGQDTATVDILDNDGECGYVYAHASKLNIACMIISQSGEADIGNFRHVPQILIQYHIVHPHSNPG